MLSFQILLIFVRCRFVPAFIAMYGFINTAFLNCAENIFDTSVWFSARVESCVRKMFQENLFAGFHRAGLPIRWLESQSTLAYMIVAFVEQALLTSPALHVVAVPFDGRYRSPDLVCLTHFLFPLSISPPNNPSARKPTTHAATIPNVEYTHAMKADRNPTAANSNSIITKHISCTPFVLMIIFYHRWSVFSIGEITKHTPFYLMKITLPTVLVGRACFQ